MAEPATTRPTPDRRDKLIRAVHAAARAAGLDQDDRHAMQLELTGKASLTDMSFGELGRVLDRLNARKSSSPLSERPWEGKIKALWWSLYWLGAVNRADSSALDAFIRRQAGVDRLRFLDARKALLVIEALKAWLAREGVRWWPEESIARVQVGIPEFTQALADRHAVLTALGNRMHAARLVRSAHITDLATAMLGRPGFNALMLSAAELDLVIQKLGRKLRRHLEEQGGGGGE